MKVRIKTHDGEALNYETQWACGFDFKNQFDETLEAWEFKLIETWTVVEVPEGHMLQLAPRSSTYKKLGLLLMNSVWYIDQDYCWDDDTIKFAYKNMTDKKVEIKAWTRIGQWAFLQIMKADFELVETMGNETRWGFWTTGL